MTIKLSSVPLVAQTYLKGPKKNTKFPTYVAYGIPARAFLSDEGLTRHDILKMSLLSNEGPTVLLITDQYCFPAIDQRCFQGKISI